MDGVDGFHELLFATLTTALRVDPSSDVAWQTLHNLAGAIDADKNLPVSVTLTAGQWVEVAQALERLKFQYNDCRDAVRGFSERLRAANEILNGTERTPQTGKRSATGARPEAAKRQREALRALGLAAKKQPIYDGRKVLVRYKELIYGRVDKKTGRAHAALSPAAAIRKLAVEYGFPTRHAYYQFLKSIGVEGLPSTRETDGIFD